MKQKILTGVCLLCFAFAQAQNMTGIWRGYFYSGLGMFKQRYKYEVQINELNTKALQGVTYSYRTTEFYGKATLRGIYQPANKAMVFKEKVLVEVRSGSNVRPCLMTCYLDYHRQGGVDILQGTFTSIVLEDSSDCGAGTVYLERVEESDFEKEDFLVKKPARPPVATKPAPPAVRKPAPVKKDTAAVVFQKPAVKIKDSFAAPTTEPLPPPPPALIGRESSLVRKIVTSSPDIKVQLYDNGQIDGDTITVYHNNQVAAFKKELDKKPITLHISATPSNRLHEFVMYADNLGKIPPNTALMVVTTGGKRYELFITSSLQKNAKVVIEYQPGAE